LSLSKTGYTFVGWSLTDGGTAVYGDGATITVTGDIDLYVVWSANPTYGVTYSVNGGTGSLPTDATAYLINATVTVSFGTLPSKAGYHFIGWSTNPAASVATYVSGGTESFTLTGVTVLYAIYAPNTNTVTFKDSSTTIGTQTFATGAADVLPAFTTLSYTKTGYFFAGWSLTDGGAIAYGDEALVLVNSDKTLYAVWQVNPAVSYTVTYLGSGNDTGSVPVDASHYAAAVSVTVMGNSGSLTRVGFSFVGWCSQAVIAGNNCGGVTYLPGDTFTITSDKNLYAIWTSVAATYSVTYNASSGSATGSVPVDSGSYTASSTVTVLGNTGSLALSGYNFAGWCTQSVLPGQMCAGTTRAPGSTFTITSATSLYAIWTAVAATYSVTYNASSGSATGSVPVDSGSYVSSSTVTVLGNTGSLALSGYNFAGWCTQVVTPGATCGGATRAAGSTFTISSATSLYAIWTAVAATYTVTYNAPTKDSGSVPTDSNAYGFGVTVTVAGNIGSLTKSGYVFGGWCTATLVAGAACTATTHAPGAMFTISSNVELYAIWIAPGSTYSVTYFPSSGSATGSVPVDSVLYNSGSSVTVLGNVGNLALVGFSFVGWCTQVVTPGSTCGGTTRLPGSTFTITAGTSLYALWATSSNFTVTYAASGATGSAPVDGVSPYISGATVTIVNGYGTLAYTNFAFGGWCSQSVTAGAVCGGVTYTQGTTFVINANTVLYAIWKSTFNVTYYANSATGSAPVDSSRYVTGATVTVLANTGPLSLTNYLFNGWCTSNSSVSTCAAGTWYAAGVTFPMAAANVNLYAMWLPIPGATIAQGTNSTPLNTAVTLTATVSTVGSAGVPTGTATFQVNGSTVGSCVLTAGTCSISYSAMAVGANSVLITYSGSAAYAAATSSPIIHSVTASGVATALTVSGPASVAYGATNTVLTATISPLGATGTVTFYVGVAAIGTCTLTGTSTTCTLTAPSSAFVVGANSVTASFAGTGSYLASNATAITITATKGTVTPVVTSSLPSSVFGGSVTFTVTIPSSAATPTGLMTFTTLVGATLTTLGTCTLASGSCSFITSALPVGALTVTATYAGDGNYNVASATVAQTVAKATPTVSLTTASASVGVGVAFNLVASVAGPVGTTAAGTVTFSAVNTVTNISTQLGTCTLVAGSCTLNVLGTKLPRGTYRVTAAYGGSASFNSASNNPALVLTITNSGLRVITSAASASYRTALTITGNLTKFGTTANFTGTITFTTLVNSQLTTLGSCKVAVASCSITYSLLPVGTYVITGTYSGDAAFAPASGTVAQVIVKRTATISVTSLIAGVVGSQKSTLSITLGTPGATGLVTILDGTTVLGTCTVTTNAAGTASICSFVTPILAKGTHSITAVYAGDGNFTTVTSAVLAVKAL
jgi:uncharacterized repeat protein (TIGR02543 family)